MQNSTKNTTRYTEISTVNLLQFQQYGKPVAADEKCNCKFYRVLEAVKSRLTAVTAYH